MPTQRSSEGARARRKGVAPATAATSFPAVPRSLRESYSALREEYLRLKALTFAEHTRLPTQDAVLPELRSRMDGHASMAVFVLGIANLPALEQAFGWKVADDLLAAATEEVRDLVTGQFPRGSVIAQDGSFGEQLLVFVPREDPPRASVEDLESLEAALGAAVRQGLRRRFVTEAGEARLATGFSVAGGAPGLRFERLVGRAVAAARNMLRDQAERARQVHRLELADILERRSITVVYQPIIDLRTFAITGFEALCRGPVRTPFEVAEFMFSVAHELDLGPELDALCQDMILGNRVDLGPGGLLFVNVLPESIEHGRVEAPRFRDLAAALGLPPDRIVLEIAERSRVSDHATFRQRLEPFKQAGFLLALDDIGTGYSSLRLVPEVEPEFLKVDMSLVRDIDRHPGKQGVLGTIVDLAARLGSRVVCEGIESRSELETIIGLGADHGQGFHLLEPSARPVLAFRRPEGLGEADG